jgi:hypothetical protein
MLTWIYLAGTLACVLPVPSYAEERSQPHVDDALIQLQQILQPEADASEGRRYALQYCQSCHLFVEPQMLSRAIWTNVIIPRMGGRLGMHHAGYDYASELDYGNSDNERAIIAEAQIFANSPLVPTEHWDKLTAYLIENAPSSLPPSDSPIAITRDLALFEVAPWSLSRQPPMTTLVHIDEPRKRLMVGDAFRQSLTIFDAAGRVTQELPTGSPPIHVRVTDAALWITTIGIQIPSDIPRGKLIVAELNDGQYRFYPGHERLDRLRRPTFTSFHDLDHDGLEDVIVSEFGNRLGQFTHYQAVENITGIEYKAGALLAEPGSMASQVYDFNGDGWSDIALVVGQNREGIHIFYNLGNGNFRRSWALQLPPNYGSSHFELYDFNHDGYIDVLATTGDNGDYSPILKNYHGIRIYLNDGKNRFVERYFFHMNGAFKAQAADFDLDGDLDIVGISMFADYDNRPEEGFVYLENKGNFTFVASTVDAVNKGRWLTMDTGDLDGDGDQDVVLGSFTTLPTRHQKRWQSADQPFLYLQNRHLNNQ